ncbi:MAG: guanylate kinase [Bacilli bacterium]|nr:guanylate kinase [Bacilli bacterium]
MGLIKTKTKGSLIVISGPSGVGKDTIVNEYTKTHNDSWLSISMTSREMRKGEKEGENYYFVSKKDFEEKIEEGFFLEYAKYVNNYYGTPKKYINEKLDQGIDVFLVIEIQGAAKIKELIPEAIFIFLFPPSLNALKSRLKNRGTDSEEKINQRFLQAYKEMNEVTKYNYVVVNDEISNTIKKIEAILISEKCRCDRIEEVVLNNPEEFMHEMLLSDKEMQNKEIKIEEEM